MVEQITKELFEEVDDLEKTLLNFFPKGSQIIREYTLEKFRIIDEELDCCCGFPDFVPTYLLIRDLARRYLSQNGIGYIYKS